jgi:hypothetical protein
MAGDKNRNDTFFLTKRNVVIAAFARILK